ncbi:M56 family metallopeptidase [Geothrix fuzhouensis]|uniref:M56 family metallopeptidase n=1 Tax=Geothrix fuzhouensis TaxID=2966451 RepID=UPI002148C953|nr:M56 family metallopeptidase [Geothrix fuzhouensis]
MNQLLSLVQEPWAQALGWSLLHFLWQGAALALLAWLLLALLRGAPAQARYGAACAFLLLMAAAPVATFLLIQRQTPALAQPPRVTVAAAGSAVAPTLVDAPLALRVKTALDPALPWLLGTWALGVLLLSTRFLGSWVRVQRLRRHSASPVPAEWHLVLSRLCRELKLSRTVRLLQSAAVEVPTALGWLRPIILLPACALTGLAPLQLEAVLAHELAHIRRGDFLVNLLQSLVEVVLFYHPAVWWLSGRIRAERELCCDDVAAGLCGDPLILARALTDLEALREPASSTPTHLALAANGGSLMHRVRHLLQPTTPTTSSARTAALALLTASLLGAAGVAFQGKDKEPSPKAAQTTRVKVIDGDRQMDVRLEGEVKLDPAAKEPVTVPGAGSFRVEEKKAGKARTYTATKDKRTYTVDGQEQPLDAEGEAWLRETVKDAAKAQKAKDKAQRIEIRTRRMDAQTRELDAHLKDLDAHLKDLDRLPELSPEERAKVRADLDKARADLEKARAERRKVRMEVIRKKGEAGKDVEILTEDVGPDMVVIRKRVDGKDVIEKRARVAGKGHGGTGTSVNPEDEEDMVVEVPGDITVPPIHIPEIHIGHPGVEADPQVEIRALQSAMKSMQKRLDQLQKQMAEAPRGVVVPPPPPVPPAPPAPPAPPTPPTNPGPDRQ